MSASSLQTIIKVGHVSFSARLLISLTYPVLTGQFMDKIKTLIKKKNRYRQNFVSQIIKASHVSFSVRLPA